MSEVKVKLLKMVSDQSTKSNLVLRAAIYARFSCSGNSPYSADEQIQRIKYRVETGQVRSRKYPNAKIEIVESWVIKDEAKTGRVSRDGYELIKSGVSSRAFDMLLMDDISRMTRDMGATIDLYEALEFASIEGVSVADSISTVDSNARDLFIFKGYANEHQSKATSKNTIRGLELRVLGGYSTGHKPYGYYSRPTKTAIIRGVERPSHFEIKIDPEQATVVIRIWTMYANGAGCHSIATLLNEEGILPPGRGKKRWSEKSVWSILQQEKYRGIWKYRQTKVVKNPNTDRLTQKERPKEEWLVSEREDLRIIPHDLELRVNTRKTEIAKVSREVGQRFKGCNMPKHLFIGTMKCAECGGNFILVSGKNGGYLGCWNAHRQTVAESCTNRRTIQMAWVEKSLVDELKQQMDRPETAQYIAQKYNELMRTKHGEIPKRLTQLNESIAEKERMVANFLKFIADGNCSEAVSQGLVETEAALKTLKAERDYLKPQMDNRVYVTPSAIKERLLGLDEILGTRTVEANGVLKRLVLHG